MYSGGYDGSSSLFSGGGFMPSQATQTVEGSVSKSRGSQVLLPLTAKQISEALGSNDDKSSFAVDGVEATSVRLVGIVTNKVERVTDVSFTLDDGTCKIPIQRWVQEPSDASEMDVIQNGMYVVVNGSLKGFQGKRHVMAFSVRPVIDFNTVTLHFIECIHVHLENTRPKTPGAGLASVDARSGVQTPMRNNAKGYQTAASNVYSSHANTYGAAGDIHQKVLDVFQDPAFLDRENGLHVNEVAQRLNMPVDKIKEVIAYHVDDGQIYSTIDDNHFKSTMNG